MFSRTSFLGHRLHQFILSLLQPSTHALLARVRDKRHLMTRTRVVTTCYYLALPVFRTEQHLANTALPAVTLLLHRFFMGFLSAPAFLLTVPDGRMPTTA